MAVASTIGDRFDAYNAELAGNGWTENVAIGANEYPPSSTANKSYFLRLIRKNSKVYNGNSEGTTLHFEAFVIYQFPRNKDFGDAQADAWDDLDKVERALLGLGATRGEAVTVETIELGPMNEDWHLGTLTFKVWYQRSTKE
jgi:hypothetical protein